MKNYNEMTYEELQISVNQEIKKAQKQLNELASNMDKQWDAIIYTRKQQIRHINEEKLRGMGLNRVEPRLTPDAIIKGLL